MSVNAVNSDGSLLRVAGGTLYADAPIGTISPFGGSAIPSGYLLCNGQAVSRTNYKELFAVIRVAFGSGDGSTTFNLPDMREAVPKGAGLTGHTVGAHLDADGLAVGEFLDDRVQSHTHSNKTGTSTAGQVAWTMFATSEIGSATEQTNNGVIGRFGATTEVKAVGVNYIIKAKQVAVPFDFIGAINNAVDDALSAFAKPISLVSVNNSTISFDKSKVIGGTVTVCASITVSSGNHLVKENAVANVPNLGTGSIGYILPCLYRNIGNGAEEPGYAIIQTNGNLHPYYTKTEYNEIRINASYSSKN